MTCSVDPIAWGEKNRVALATGKTQEWVLARTTRDRPTVDSVVMTARAVLVKWFEGTPLDTQFADVGDAVDDVSVVAVSDTPPAPGAGDQRRESLDPFPMLAAGPTPPLYVTVHFNYRGYAKDLPWPVWRASASPLKVDKICPLDADWMLVLSRATDRLATAPAEQGPLDKLASHGTSGLGELGADLALLTDAAKWGLLLYLGVQAFQLTRSLPTVKRRAS